MSYKVLYSKRANENAERIVSYIKYVLLSPKAAENFILSLKRKEKDIATNPHLYPSEFFGKHLYRYAMIKRYIIVFRIDEGTHIVNIIAIGHSLQKRKNIIK